MMPIRPVSRAQPSGDRDAEPHFDKPKPAAKEEKQPQEVDPTIAAEQVLRVWELRASLYKPSDQRKFAESYLGELQDLLERGLVNRDRAEEVIRKLERLRDQFGIE